jgi:hypothetical protein
MPNSVFRLWTCLRNAPASSVAFGSSLADNGQRNRRLVLTATLIMSTTNSARP